MLVDSPDFQALMVRLFPELRIDGVAKASGQRVVYFCRFVPPSSTVSRPNWSHWGDVVLKVSPGSDAHAIAYMQMEISVLNSLESPYFPRLRFHEIFSEIPETEERLPIKLFVTIEDRVPSEPLSNCGHRFSTEAAVLDLLIQLVEAMMLLWLHERRLVHRDLKPDNILIRPDNGICIIDLGILRETGAQGITDTGAHHGPLTPGFCSPEQVQNEKLAINFKSDFFSLATIAYQLLAGRNPYVDSETDSKGQILANVVSRKPTRLDAQGRCSKPTADVLERMMQKEQFKRHRTPQMLLNELRAVRGALDE